LKLNCRPLLFLFIAGLGISCVGTRHLKEGEYLLYNQNIKTEQSQIKERLKNQLAQEPNKRLLGLPITPYTFVYYTGEKSFDIAKLEAQMAATEDKYNNKINSSKNSQQRDRRQKKLNRKLAKIETKISEGNLLMRWGEPLSVFDSTITDRSRRNLEVYMRSNGWFRSTVSYKVKLNGKQANVEYQIKDGPQYRIDTLLYNIQDSAILNIVKDSYRTSKLKKGNPYRQDNLSDERDRIDEILKNKGYFDFTRQYVVYQVDSTVGDHKVAIKLSILNPLAPKVHKPFVLDSVTFTAEFKQGITLDKYPPLEYKNITYDFADRYYSEKVLNRRIHLRPGQVYSRENTLNTQRELAGMDMYKFVNVNFDTLGGKFLANIFVSPLDKYQWTAEAGLTITRALPGPFASISLKQRNVFKTFGIFEINGNIGVEGVAAASNPDDVLASLEAGGFASLTFPRFFIPLSDENKQKLGFYNPKTIFKAGVTFTDRPEFIRSNLNASNYYTWQPKQNILVDFRLLEVALTRTNKLDSAYFERLRELERNGNNLINSFRPSFISNQRFMRSVNINNYGRGNNNASYFSIMVEPGGTFTNIWAQEFFARDSLEIYAYIKLDTDFRRTFRATRNSSWAFRVRSGVAYAYGANELLPYEKYFFSGGSISNRAWKPRRLGPGSFDHLEEDGQVSYQFEQQGEIILESSIEFRHKLIGFLNWAAFIDAGNIWTLREDLTRPGAQFQINRFYQEIAVGAGLGLRLDFSFFILRFDTSAKIVDPARPLGKRFILSPGFTDPPFDNPQFTEPLVYTLSIGYPF
jgi:outer membrane protein insertion porin family